MQSDLAISIDFKRNRIRVHKGTLHAMGNPEYIQFLVDPEQRAFAIVRSDRSDLLAHRLHWPRLARGQCFELHSKPLVKSLLGLCGDWREDQTYRINGGVAPGKEAAFFHVADCKLA